MFHGVMQGNTYIKASYSYALPKDFSLDTALGLYAYQDSGDFEDNLGTTESFGFRHFDIGLSKPLADTGVTASMNYTVGGYDRADEKQKNKVVFGFEIRILILKSIKNGDLRSPFF